MNYFIAPIYSETQLEQMDYKDIVFPFSDDYMYYDGKRHQYVIKEKALDMVDNTWKKYLTDKTPNGVRNFLLTASMKFYTYAYQHSRSNNNQINYLIAKRGLKSYPNMMEYRNDICSAIVSLAFYMLINGDLSMVSGVDLESMTSISIETIRYEERDYPQRYKQTMSDLGLAFYGRYTFIASGIGEEW